MFHKQIVILGNREIAPGYFLMELASPQIAKNSSPGQFLHIKCSPNHNLLLPRPFSIHRVISEKEVEILYKVVGKGTLCLSKRKKGEKINCIGPLGKGFELPQSLLISPLYVVLPPSLFSKENRGDEGENKGGQSAILFVAGGVGIAPLIYLIAKCKMQNAKCKTVVFLGAKTKDEILCVKELKNLGAEIHIATEDGSMGYRGLVSQLLKNKLSSVCRLSSVVYACGPKGMLKEVALLSEKYKIPCQVSFEQFMGCGIGICNSCVIRTKQGYRRVCKDGPVFRAEKIDWEKI